MKKNAEIPVNWIHQQVLPLLGEQEVKQLLDSFQQPSPVSIRINPFKYNGKLTLPQVPWCPQGYYLPQRPSFTRDPLFHAGVYYVQEASSMFVAYLANEWMKQNANIAHPVFLDTCAAPGGKTTLLSAIGGKNAVVVANEVIKKRFHILEENSIKWGSGNIIPVNADTTAWQSQQEMFNIVLVDAPCSGEGLWRKDADAIDEWSEKNVYMCASRQKEILQNVWNTVKPGGWLIYSTCTLNTLENEENVKWMLGNLKDAAGVNITVDADWNIYSDRNSGTSCFRFFPHKIQGEGFFAAVIQKNGEGGIRKNISGSIKTESLPATISNVFKSEKLAWKNKENEWLAADKHVVDVLQQLTLLTYSTDIFKVYHQTHQSYSPYVFWRHDLNYNHFKSINVSDNEALSFLMCDTSRFRLDIEDKTPHLAMYKGHPLGFIRKTGNAVKIDYPRNWRILKQGAYSGVLPE